MARVAGVEVVLPPRESLGWFTRPGNCEAVGDWLCEAPSDRVIVSLDMLCFGGLVASRSPQTELSQALARLQALRELRRRRPKAAVFGSNVVMRLGATVASGADVAVHGLLRSYSELLDRVDRLGESGLRRELLEVQGKLPPEALASYLAVRRRNHAVNRAAVQLVAEGVLDFLVLAQEDASPVGIHIPEQVALREQVQEFRLGDRVVLTCGADEVGLTLLARQVCHASGAAPALAADFGTAAGGEAIPAFESQPLRRTVADHIAIAGCRPVAPGSADAVLFLHTPIAEQHDILVSPPAGPAPSLALQADSVAERVEIASAAGLSVGVADVAYCNGADPELVAALERRRVIGRLGAFAGWNTAANTVGTAVANLALLVACGGPERRAGESRSFVSLRLIDDFGYQSDVRARASFRARELGADPLRLGDDCPELERFVANELSPFVHRFFSDPGAGEDPPAVAVSLPWCRLFEVELGPASEAEPKNLR